MFINVLSRHLPVVVEFIGTRVGDRVLEFVHLVEMARYHQTRIHSLCEGREKTPPDFVSGTSMRGAELDLHWRGMTSVFELEAFLLAVKRSLDAAWRCSRDSLPELLSSRARGLGTLGDGMYKIDEESRMLLPSAQVLTILWQPGSSGAGKLFSFEIFSNTMRH